MKNTVKRLFHFQFNQYKDIELKLEKMARKGLFLEHIGTTFWTFRKEAPRTVHYTVTYFSEASIFNPTETEHQQIYFDYAEEAGWHFVAQFNQMQVFMSEEENPIPFETDESEKLANIKRCMRKNFIPSTLALIIVFLMNLWAQYSSYKQSPTDFLAETYRLFPVMVMLPSIVYFIYTLLAYWTWCRQSEKSIHSGGGCIEKTKTWHKIVDISFLIYLLCTVIFYLLSMMKNNNLFFLILIILQVPLLTLIFNSSIKYLKKKKYSATLNKVVSYSLLTLASFAYIIFIVLMVLNFDVRTTGQTSYRTVNWELSPTESRTYKLYSEALPLTCEDLYGATDYAYYSYEKETDQSLFLTRSTYRQDGLPGKEMPPRIAYVIIETKFDFVYNLVAADLKRIPKWSNRKLEPLSNDVFGTIEAYEFYYDRDATNDYLLFYADKLIYLSLDDSATPEQIAIIKNKLLS